MVIPTYRRPAALARCLGAVARLDYPRELIEVIVVDDCGDVPGAGSSWAASGIDVTLLRGPGRGPAAARNLGVAQAGRDFVAFTDDDCLPSPGWLRALAAHLADDRADVVCGRTVNAVPSSAGAQASDLILDCLYRHYNSNARSARFFVSNNLALGIDLFRRLGGFDTGFRTSEDRDLCDRLLHGGHRVTYAPEAVVHHARPSDLVSFWHQHFGYGRGAWRFHRARAQRRSGRLRDELGFYRTLARSLREYLGEPPPKRAAALLGLLALWQVANAAGYASEATRVLAGRGGRPG